MNDKVNGKPEILKKDQAAEEMKGLKVWLSEPGRELQSAGGLAEGEGDSHTGSGRRSQASTTETRTAMALPVPCQVLCLIVHPNHFPLLLLLPVNVSGS